MSSGHVLPANCTTAIADFQILQIPCLAIAGYLGRCTYMWVGYGYYEGSLGCVDDAFPAAAPVH